MKNKFLKFLLIFNIYFCISQDYNIPAIKFEGNSGSPNFVKMLGLKDENSLIISMGYSGYWQKGTISKFIVYQNNGKVLKYNVYFKNDLENPKVIQKKLPKRKYKLYWTLLNESFINNMFQIEKEKLNIKEKPASGRMVTTSIISDGTNYIFNHCCPVKVL
jgi:hypothetical protein